MFVRQILSLPVNPLDRNTSGTVQCGQIDVNKIQYDKKRYLILGVCLCIGNHKVLSLLRCGRLVYHLGLPYSFLSFQYVEEAIKIAYCENKCGNCSYTVFCCFILYILGKEMGFGWYLNYFGVINPKRHDLEFTHFMGLARELLKIFQSELDLTYDRLII